MRTVACKCFFCTQGQEHTERHQDYREVTGRLKVAESLNPADIIRIEACVTCGHSREKK